jgi:hypothetical protein
MAKNPRGGMHDMFTHAIIAFSPKRARFGSDGKMRGMPPLMRFDVKVGYASA